MYVRTKVTLQGIETLTLFISYISVLKTEQKRQVIFKLFFFNFYLNFER